MIFVQAGDQLVDIVQTFLCLRQLGQQHSQLIAEIAVLYQVQPACGDSLLQLHCIVLEPSRTTSLFSSTR